MCLGMELRVVVGGGEMSHTPGPWTLEDVMGNGLRDICGPDVPGEGSPNLLAHAFRKSDAHLISAAPDLLEACRDVLIYFTDFERGLIETQLHETLTKAIAKAEGK